MHVQSLGILFDAPGNRSILGKDKRLCRERTACMHTGCESPIAPKYKLTAPELRISGQLAAELGMHQLKHQIRGDRNT